ncbi:MULTISPECIES: lipoyl(octanoyl) transferase LipB [Corallococcus]|uniref:lipoyl(octanoyl) transferase LipB n=1 Tax=Corallococcus TaxID=83461 RepID=UPI00117BE5BB|nr:MULTISPECIES: lipoyl(octanoyl) transferase LipB [Corallococcus]NBD12010.1 lipoyl(octanoyl) transferase LipB [Corallococcus silvisoli]TSC26010.1 lipoyl(octanoyl) transferase LipB [Corallococcus sp. Z5C101001]
MSTLTIFRLGRVEYEDGLKLMHLFGEARLQERIGDALLLLEHPPVLTLGRAAKRENITATDAHLAEQGVEVFDTNRGGDVTYHGPGQVVGYPILLLPPERRDVRRYVRDVERGLIQTLAAFGLTAGPIPKWPGVWLGQEGAPDARKIGAIGVHLSRWLTTHGFALNVNTNLAHFQLIVPCGIREAGVTSMQRELGHAVSVPEVEEALAREFTQVFDAQRVDGAVDVRTVSVAVVRGHGPDARVLLLHRTPERGGFWQTVTGRLEPGELPASAARRELSEETGLDLPVRDLEYRHAFALGDVLPPKLVEEHGFAVHAAPDAQVRLGPEHDAFEWVDVPTALERLPFRGLRETVARALKAHGP